MVNTVSGIATYIVNTFSNIPLGISGTMYQTVDAQRMYVQNYTGQTIDPNGLSEQVYPIIQNLSLAFLLNLKISNGDGGTTSLGEMSVSDQGALLSAQQYQKLAEMQLKAIPRAVQFARSLSY
jgi:hypothetical protein